MPHSCIIVEDDPIDRLMSEAMVKRYPDLLKLEGSFDNGTAALEFLAINPVQVMFSDVEMEGMTGLDLRRQAMNLPVCIFISSYAEYAADSFTLAALDYIVKPITGERFESTINRLKDYLEIKQKANLFDYSLGERSIYIKDGVKLVKVALHDVLYLEALRDYTLVVTRHKKHCVLGTLQHMLDNSNFQSFIRIHRSYAVQKHYISIMDAGHIYVEDVALPLARSYREQVMNVINQ